jgi:hypothetical protein
MHVPYPISKLNHQQPGDLARLARALLTIVDDPNPPLRMPFGSDTVAGIEAKNAFVAEELAKWRDLAISTDYPVEAVSA